MRVNIVCTDTGWIYDQFVNAFRKYSGHEVLRNSLKECDITHYLPYYEVPKPKKVRHPCTSWFSHQEIENKTLYHKFISAGHEVDVAISQSKKYATILKANGVGDVAQIVPGIDFDKFKIDYKPRENKKMVVGYVGRQYSSSKRKNPALLKKISEMCEIEFRTTNGKLKQDDIPGFYAGLDLVVSPALIEGGPMCIQEALSMGKPVLCYGGVGMADEFKMGVITVPFNNPTKFLQKLQKICHDKIYKTWYNESIMRQTRSQVEGFTWENFVKQHDLIWSSIYEKI